MVRGPCAPSAMSTDGRLSSGAPAQAWSVRCARSRDWGESRRCIGWLATPPCNGIVRMTWEIRVPESLHPLHELEIIPGVKGDARENVEGWRSERKKRTAFCI
jgi:hypothetical protein